MTFKTTDRALCTLLTRIEGSACLLYYEKYVKNTQDQDVIGHN